MLRIWDWRDYKIKQQSKGWNSEPLMRLSDHCNLTCQTSPKYLPRNPACTILRDLVHCSSSHEHPMLRTIWTILKTAISSTMLCWTYAVKDWWWPTAIFFWGDMTKETKIAKYLMSMHNLQMQRASHAPRKKTSPSWKKKSLWVSLFFKSLPTKKKPTSFFNHVDSVFKVVLPILQGLKQAITSY